MKVKELMAILSKCDPEAFVTNKDCKNFSRSLYYWDISVEGVYIVENKNDNLGLGYIQKTKEVPLEKANVILVG